MYFLPCTRHNMQCFWICVGKIKLIWLVDVFHSLLIEFYFKNEFSLWRRYVTRIVNLHFLGWGGVLLIRRGLKEENPNYFSKSLVLLYDTGGWIKKIKIRNSAFISKSKSVPQTSPVACCSLCLSLWPDRKCKAKVLICSEGAQGSGVLQKNFPKPRLLASWTTDWLLDTVGVK